MEKKLLGDITCRRCEGVGYMPGKQPFAKLPVRMTCPPCMATGREALYVPLQIACGALPDPSGLLAWVIADPADDTVRLAYADWLDENGGSEWAGRGDFIRGMINSPQTIVLFVDGPAWTKDLDGLRTEWWDDHDTGRGGFILRVVCTWEAWTAHGDAFRAREWVPQVKLTTPPTADQEDRDRKKYVRFAGREWRASEGLGLRLGDYIPEKLLPVEWPGTEFEYEKY